MTSIILLTVLVPLMISILIYNIVKNPYSHRSYWEAKCKIVKDGFNNYVVITHDSEGFEEIITRVKTLEAARKAKDVWVNNWVERCKLSERNPI